MSDNIGQVIKEIVGDNWWSVEAGCDGEFYAKVAPWNVDCRKVIAWGGETPAEALGVAASIARQKADSVTEGLPKAEKTAV